MTNQERIYTPQELALVLKCDITTIYRYIKGGKLAAFKLGKSYRVREDDFERFIQENKMQ